jgi:hypothetical protein
MSNIADEQNRVRTPRGVISSPITEAANSVKEHIDSSLAALGLLSTVRTIFNEQQHDINEDFRWFTSGEVDTHDYKGQFIAISRKQIVGYGESPLEAELMAKAIFGENCRPATAYIPENEDVIL